MPFITSLLSFTVVLLLLLVALYRPETGLRLLDRLETWCDVLAQQQRLCMALLGLTSLALCVGLARNGIPQPGVHDEFSYLLAGDTFAHGRLTNPTPPLWKHFETYHTLFEPTYASKYPPMQGLTLALGQILCGQPIVGVWLTIALACMALYWMLLAWFSPRWALVGGILAVTHPTVLDWSQTYWGGSTALLGGALLMGSMRRLGRKPTPRHAVFMAVGIGILANSRPYEGLLLTLMSLVLLGAQWRHHRLPMRLLVYQALLPGLVVLALTAVWMGYYNARVTGHPTQMPYMVHTARYTAAPLFVFQKPGPTPHYNHAMMQAYHLRFELATWQQEHSVSGILWSISWKTLSILARGFRLPVLLLGLLGILWALRQPDPWVRAALGMFLLFCGGLTLGTWFQHHYLAPGMGLALIVAIFGLRALSAWRWKGRPTGRFLVGMALICSVLISLARLAKPETALEGGWQWSFDRARIQAQLSQDGQKHLILVRYAANHNPSWEWVFNGADFASAPVLWARDMGKEQNRELLDFYRNRHIWLLDVDRASHTLKPYPLALCSGVTGRSDKK